MEGIEKAKAKRAIMREKGIEMIPRTAVEKMIDNPRIGRAVRVFCWQCGGYTTAGIADCGCVECPLWLFRRSIVPKAEELTQFRERFRAEMEAVGEYDPEHHRKAKEAAEAAKSLGIDADAEGDEETQGETPEEKQK